MRIFLSFFITCIVVLSAQAEDFPKLKGWKPISEVSSYEPENLWEYINGAAELFLAYGFQFLRSCDLDGSGISVTVDIYDMGNSLNAYGMYQTERPEDVKRLKMGGEAIVSPPYQGLLLKDRYYVKVNIFDGALTEAIGKSILEQLAKALPGADGFPEQITLLPPDNMVSGSEGFVREGYLGQTDLTNVITAQYKDQNNQNFGIFIIVTDTVGSSESTWPKLQSNWESITYRGQQVLIKKIPYRGIVGIMNIDGEIRGITESKDETELTSRLKHILY